MISPSRSRPSSAPGRSALQGNHSRAKPASWAEESSRTAKLGGLFSCPELTLQRHLKQRGLWLPDSCHESILLQCKTSGKLLKREVLKKVLGPSDYEYIQSTNTFGLESRRIRRSLRSVLSFGFQLGSGFANWLGVEPQLRENIAATCGLFAAMTMLFDRCLDDLGNGPELLGCVFDEGVMRRLAGSRQGGRELAKIAAHHRVPEIRITLKVVCGFYARAWALADIQADVWQSLNRLLIDAYRAEMRSLCSQGPRETTEVAAATKGLPVQIMFHIALSGAKEHSREACLKGAELARNIGLVVWRADDLIDLLKDLRRGSANALLCEARSLLPPHLTTDDEQVLQCLVENHLLEMSADQLCQTLEQVTTVLESESPQRQTSLDFRQLLLAFARSWGR
jgi:hypothetical protein